MVIFLLLLSRTAEALSVPSLQHWLNEVNVESGDVRIGTCRYGSGVIADRAVGMGEVIFSVPCSAVVTRDVVTSGDCDFASTLSDLVNGDSELLAYAAWLLWQRSHDSKWASYVRALPWETIDTATLWSNAELSRLRGSAAHERVLELHAQIDGALTLLYDSFAKNAIFIVLPGSSVPQPAHSATIIDFAEALRVAVALVTSRAFDLGPLGPCNLVPLLDMCNSATESGKAHPFLFEELEDAVVLRAGFPLRPGEEVEDHYGITLNAHLLVHYGYIVSDGPPETQGVLLDFSLDADDPLRAWKEALLGERNLRAARSSFEVLPFGSTNALSVVCKAWLRLAEVRAGSEEHVRLSSSGSPWDVLEGRPSIFDPPADEPYLGSNIERRAAARLLATLSSTILRYDGDPSMHRDQSHGNEACSGRGRERIARSLVELELRTLRGLEVAFRDALDSPSKIFDVGDIASAALCDEPVTGI